MNVVKSLLRRNSINISEIFSLFLNFFLIFHQVEFLLLFSAFIIIKNKCIIFCLILKMYTVACPLNDCRKYRYRL